MIFDRHVIEAKLALNLIPPRDMPKIAWDALEAGLDGPAIRRLAALDRPTWFQTNEVLPSAMREMGLQSVTKGEGAARIASSRAEEILRTGADPLKFTREFEQLWLATGYESEIQQLGTLDDDVNVARCMGKSEDQIRKWLTKELEDFIAKRIRSESAGRGLQL